MFSVSPPTPPGSLAQPELCWIFQAAALTAATVVLYPAGSWESQRSNDAQNVSLHKERVKLAAESSLGASQGFRVLFESSGMPGRGSGSGGRSKDLGSFSPCLES